MNSARLISSAWKWYHSWLSLSSTLEQPSRYYTQHNNLRIFSSNKEESVNLYSALFLWVEPIWDVGECYKNCIKSVVGVMLKISQADWVDSSIIVSKVSRVKKADSKSKLDIWVEQRLWREASKCFMVMKNWQITIRLAHSSLSPLSFFCDDDNGCTTDVIIPKTLFEDSRERKK